mgnify:CR=1 FL=1
MKNYHLIRSLKMIIMGKCFFCLILALGLFTACNNKSDIRKRDIISEEVFYEILKDVHLADGIASASKSSPMMKKDSVSIYNFVLKKHNVSREDFNRTVEYYSLNAEEYNVFYDSLVNFFTVLEKELRDSLKIEKEKEIEERKRIKDSLNLWNLKFEWELPEDGIKNPIAFTIPIEEHGTYMLAATIRLFRDDKSVNQRMTIISNYTDGTRDMNSAGSMVKDGKYERYEVRITTDTIKELKSLSGWLLDHSKGTEEKHASVKEIELRLLNDEDAAK